jgi:adenylate cyclase
VGKQLEAEYVIEGSVMRTGQLLRINIQLIRVHDDAPVWSGRYDQEMTDLIAIQDEISRSIVNKLRLKIGGGRRRYEISTEAYDLYLLARGMRIRDGALGSRLIGLLQQSIDKDPSFAPSYAALAAAYAFLSGTYINAMGVWSANPADRADEVAKMRAASEKAIQLDPLLAEAHEALGIAHARAAEWEQAKKSFRRAIELDPNDSNSHTDFALYVLLVLDQTEEAVRELRLARKADPLSPEVQDLLAFILLSAGRFDEAADLCERLPANYSHKPEILGRARLAQGRADEAIMILKSSEQPNARAYLGHAYARAGQRDEAEKLAADFAPRPFHQALIFAGLGDKDRTLEALDL